MRIAFMLLTPVVTLVLGAAGTPAQELIPEDVDRADRARLEGIPHADQGNGYFRNPVLVGPGSDNTVVRVGEDFYMMAGGGWPDQLVWHSRDLVSWRPVTRALDVWDGGTWASDITFHDGRFYIYTTQVDQSRRNPENQSLTGAEVSLLGATSKTTGDRSFKNVVIWADDPAGPWSDPIDIGVYGLFDPGHVVDTQGNRYLYFNKGIMVQLTPDGLGTVGDIRQVYDGWDYPEHWAVECHCLEAPKLTYRDGYYYMASAEGGTSGPSTAHMAVVARSRSVDGPWVNSPYNPLVHSDNHDETWWRQGHGTLIDDVAGQWWFLYTGYEREFTFLGKQSLLLPVEWTEDGWPRIVPGYGPTDLIPMPAGESIGHGMPLSDDFTDTEIGIQWSYSREVDPAEAFRIGGGRLVMAAGGDSPGRATALSVRPVNHAYEVEVEVVIPETAEGGLMLGSEDDVTVGLRHGEAFAYWPRVPNALPWSGDRIFVRIRNDRGDVTCYFSPDGQRWTPSQNSTSVSGARSVSLYAAGEGDVVFRGFKYRGLD